MTQTTTHDGLALLPIPDEVLVPHTTLPVELPTRRFRAVEASALSTDNMIALATVDDETSDQPPTTSSGTIVGLGRIVETEEMAGSGHLVYIRGTARARVTDEFEIDAPLRQVRAEELDDQLASAEEAHDLIWSVRGGLLILQDRGVDGAEMLNYELSKLSEPGAVADVIGAAIFTDSAGKRRLLEELDVLARLRLVDNRLADLVVQAYHTNPPEARERN